MTLREDAVSELARDWQEAGIEAGDMVLIHASGRRVLRRLRASGCDADPDVVVVVVDSFLEAVGSNGTVLFPLFNFDFADGVPFDINHTKSRMGVISEAARKRDGAIRTKHPIYSFAVLGDRSK